MGPFRTGSNWIIYVVYDTVVAQTILSQLQIERTLFVVLVPLPHAQRVNQD